MFVGTMFHIPVYLFMVIAVVMMVIVAWVGSLWWNKVVDKLHTLWVIAGYFFRALRDVKDARPARRSTRRPAGPASHSELSSEEG